MFINVDNAREDQRWPIHTYISALDQGGLRARANTASWEGNQDPGYDQVTGTIIMCSHVCS